ncbi:competence type IV pilus ATPase ComGA [Turicibacter sp. TJ11]|uniref:competence type IV pilus ATPase ComGA n=1 Tax=Turicibacter sp. TJ11 TaxID=2806443 RepID=UPI001F484AAA|nr:competence type IV pilus ATPase ComGA [Turicibacter sp. TJ11]
MPIKTKLVSIIERAQVLKASDIHFILKDDQMLVQFRTGVLMIPHETISISLYHQLLAYIKFQAALTLTHPRQPQSGLLRLETTETTHFARVSILPTSHYQSLVLRLINHQQKKTLDEIPYFIQNADVLKDMAAMQAGLILISGPTGSGKTTTTYAFIDYLKQHLGKSIVTIEDPVEYQQPDIVQMQVNESVGMTYDVGIKEILRHDPDVIIIGEIRDVQTAHQALRAAFTGHLVISTVHAKNVVGTIHRLRDLGLSVQELEQAIVGIVNQRLIQKEDERKAVFEICFGEQLDDLFSNLHQGHLDSLPYKTIDEELYQCHHVN